MRPPAPGPAPVHAKGSAPRGWGRSLRRARAGRRIRRS
ncbi:hypothetical protein SFR_4860 [Streptomyces sp. FR-008]|nr:hypothetical protein SFR_4860 [Streptomyces sp. FR-008]